MTLLRRHAKEDDDKTLPVQKPPVVEGPPAAEPEKPQWLEPALDARGELNPRGDQASHTKQLNDAFELACTHPTEGKIQSHFRDLFLAYRERYTVRPDAPAEDRPEATPQRRSRGAQ